MSIVWLNGALLGGDIARIDPADRGFTLGDGLFETIRAADGVAVHVERHFARLRDSAAILQLPLKLDETAMRDALHAVLRANFMADAALRLTLTRGPALRGILPTGDTRPTLFITAADLPAPRPPARLIIAACTRRNEFSPLSRLKSLNYLDSIMARQEAAAAGADDALLLNTAGDVAEATAANIFLHLDGHWVTPRIADGALPGVARAVLLESGQATPVRIAPPDLARVTAAFLVNSLGRRTVSAIGDITLGEARNFCK
jgi:branched-chain amino acid aminotransferase